MADLQGMCDASSEERSRLPVEFNCYSGRTNAGWKKRWLRKFKLQGKGSSWGLCTLFPAFWSNAVKVRVVAEAASSIVWSRSTSRRQGWRPWAEIGSAGNLWVWGATNSHGRKDRGRTELVSPTVGCWAVIKARPKGQGTIAAEGAKRWVTLAGFTIRWGVGSVVNLISGRLID